MSFDKPFLNFVRAKANFSEEFGKGNRSKHKNDNQGTLSGVEAKEFYNSVIKSRNDDNDSCRKGAHSKTKKNEDVKHEETNFVASPRSSRKRSLNFSESRKTKERRTEKLPTEKTNDSFTVAPRLVNKFLQYAQEGELKDMKRLLSETSVDINVSDQFLWTALMCAAHGGHTNVVRYLLDKGALWKGVVNSQGKTALDLARAANNSCIIKLLEDSEVNKVIPKRHKSKSLSAVSKPFWCPVCKEEFTEDEKQHQSSTVHQFNCQHKPKGPYFTISDDNPGYKLMVKSGWDEERGTVCIYFYKFKCIYILPC